MAEAKTNGFRWLPSYYEALRDLPDQDRLELYDAIADFGFGHEPGELSPTGKALFCLIKPTLENSIRFEIKQVENGRKGGRPPKTQAEPKESHEKPKETQTCSGENLDIALAVAVANAFDGGGGVDYAKSPPPPSSRAEEYFRQMIDPYPVSSSMERLRVFEAELGTDVCIRAIDTAINSGKRSWNYVAGILLRKQGQGVHSLEDWDRLEADRQGAKARQVEARAQEDAPQKVDVGDLDTLLRNGEITVPGGP